MLKQAERLTQIGRPAVFEVLRNHAWAPFCAPAMTFQIFSGVSGMSRCRTPRGLNASTTELTIAGEQPIVPASPTPFTPSGFTGDGVTVWLLSIHGIIEAFGIA